MSHTANPCTFTSGCSGRSPEFSFVHTTWSSLDCSEITVTGCLLFSLTSPAFSFVDTARFLGILGITTTATPLPSSIFTLDFLILEGLSF